MEQRGRQSVDSFNLSPDPCKAGPFVGYSGLDGIHSAAGKLSERKLTQLRHHLNETNLRAAYRQLDGSKAVGIDRVSKLEYGKSLDRVLPRLSRKLKAATFHPRPSREVLIPKSNGGTRPLAVGCVEDRLVQTLMAKIYDAVYEPLFHPQSFGFRPQRSAQQAIANLYKRIVECPNEVWVVEMDIEKFFNTMQHETLLSLIQKRVGDEAFLRLTRNLLQATVLGVDGQIQTTVLGAPQGSPLSPVLANIYLHYALDSWFSEHWEEEGEMIRYADDAVFVFRNEDSAQQFRHSLKGRLQEFGLTLNLEKSGIRRFDSRAPQGELPFLGFSFFWGLVRKHKRILKVKTTPKRVAQCIQAFKEWIQFERNRKKLDTLWKLAAAKLTGHYRYYGVSFNQAKLHHYYYACVGLLYKWLNRRSQKRSFTWVRFLTRLTYNPLPKPTPGSLLLDITNGLGSESKHKLKSRMRKLRTYGSVRSRGWQQPLFT